MGAAGRRSGNSENSAAKIPEHMRMLEPQFTAVQHIINEQRVTSGNVL